MTSSSLRRFLFAYLLGGLGLATADSFLIKSTDGGRTWVDIDPGPPDPFLAWFRVDPQSSAIYALTQSCSGGACSGPKQHLMVSDDDGQTWQTRQTFPRDASFWFSLAATPTGADTVYLANQVLSGPYPETIVITRVADGGRQSEQYSVDGLSIAYEQVAGSSGGFLTGFAADSSTPSKLYALITDDASDDIYAYFQALWTSVDGGRNWKQLQPPVTAHCTYPSIWIDPSESSVYLSCGLPNPVEFWKSTDGGGSWTHKATPVGIRIWNLTLGPGSPAILYTVDSRGAIWKSTDGAGSWRLSGQLPSNALGGETFTVHPENPAVLFAGGPKGIWKSEDSGQTWAMLLASGGYWDIHIDPQAPDTLYAASASRQQVLLNDRQTFLRSIWGEQQVAPGSLVSIYGQNFAANTQSAAAPPLPLTLSGASVLIGGQAAPLLYVSPEQINAQVPFGVAGPVTMEVRKHDGSVDRQTVTISCRATFVLRENASRQSAPLLFHGSDLRPVTTDDPLRAGETLTVFATGLGELNPSIVAGSLPPTPLPQLQSPIYFGIQRYTIRDLKEVFEAIAADLHLRGLLDVREAFIDGSDSVSFAR